MFALKGIFMKKAIQKTVQKPPIAAPIAPPIKTIAVIEKPSLLRSTALSVGGGDVKTTAVVGTLGAVGATAQTFKNSLFDGLNGLTGNSLDGFGNALDGAFSGFGGLKTDIFTGLVIVGSLVSVGLIYKITRN